MDVEKQVFRSKLRGYDPEEVRYYLRSVSEEIERLNLENGELREDIGRLKRQHEELRSREQVLQKTLVSAQHMSDELKERSQAEANLVVRDARVRAERILQDAQDQLAQLEAEISRCRIEKDLFERRLRTTIEEHMILLEQRQDVTGEMDNIRVLPRRTSSEAG
jgi:cell division initiation protein